MYEKEKKLKRKKKKERIKEKGKKNKKKIPNRLDRTILSKEELDRTWTFLL